MFNLEDSLTFVSSAPHSQIINIHKDIGMCAGHFPGKPTVPAAVLIDICLLVLKKISTTPPQLPVIENAKFMTIVKPGSNIHVNWTKKNSSWSFSIHNEGAPEPSASVTINH